MRNLITFILVITTLASIYLINFTDGFIPNALGCLIFLILVIAWILWYDDFDDNNFTLPA